MSLINVRLNKCVMKLLVILYKHYIFFPIGLFTDFYCFVCRWKYDFWLGILNLKNVKHIKKKLNEELMPVAWRPNRDWDWCVPQDEKKEIKLIFTE